MASPSGSERAGRPFSTPWKKHPARFPRQYALRFRRFVRVRGAFPTGKQPVDKVTWHSRARSSGGRIAPPSAPSAPGSTRGSRPAPEARARSSGGRIAPPSAPSAPGSTRGSRPAPEARARSSGGRIAPPSAPSAPGSTRGSRPAPEARARSSGGRIAPPSAPSAPGSTRGSRPAPEATADASRLKRPASRGSSLRFGRNTLGPVLPVGAPPSRALSAGPPPGELGLNALGAHATLSTGCSSSESLRDPHHRLSRGGKTPPPRRCAPRMERARVWPPPANQSAPFIGSSLIPCRPFISRRTFGGTSP